MLCIKIGGGKIYWNYWKLNIYLYLMDMSSHDKLKNSFLDCWCISATLFLTIFNAALEKPGDPSTRLRYFRNVSRDGIELWTTVRR